MNVTEVLKLYLRIFTHCFVIPVHVTHIILKYGLSILQYITPCVRSFTHCMLHSHRSQSVRVAHQGGDSYSSAGGTQQDSELCPLEPECAEHAGQCLR